MRTISEDTQRNLASPEAKWPRDILIGGRSLQKLFLINIPTRTTSLTRVFRIIARREVVKKGPVFVCGELLLNFIDLLYRKYLMFNT